MTEPSSRAADARTRSLASLGALDVLPSQELHRTTRLAAHLARTGDSTPMAAVHLLDGTSLHRVAETGGLPRHRAPVETALCVQVVEGDRAVYAPDASSEARFQGNHHTTGPGSIGLYYGTPLRLSDGSMVGTLCVLDTQAGELTEDQRARLDDLAEQTSAHLELAGISQDLAHLATHDSLTGVANRLKVSHALATALADPERLAHEPSLLVVDLDDFKAVNDTYGHGVGDQVLAGTAARLLASVRQQDIVGRLGGDEFVVLIQDLEDPSLLAEIVARISVATAAPYDTTAGPVTCTATVGTALGEAGDLPYELLGRADAQMYERKQATR